MKKDLTKTFLFSIVVAAVLLFAFFEIKKLKNEDDLKEISNKVVQIDSTDLVRLKFKDSEVVKGNLTWTLKTPLFDYLEHDLVDEWVTKALSQEGRLLSDKGEVIRWQKFGLDDPISDAEFFSRTGVSVKVELSSKEAFDESLYLRVTKKGFGEELNGVYLYSTTQEWKSFFNKNIDLLRTQKAFDWSVPSPNSELKKIIISSGDDEIYFEKEDVNWINSSKKKWTFNQAKINSMLDDVKNFRSKGLAPKSFDKTKGKKIGTLQVVNAKNQKFKADVFKTSENKKTKYYLDSNYRKNRVVEVSKNVKSVLLPSLWSFRSFDDAVQIKEDEIVKLYYKSGSDRVTFKLKDNVWTTHKDNVPDSKELDSSKVLEVLEEFKKLNYVRYIPKAGYIGATDKILKFTNKAGKTQGFYVGRKTNCIKGESKKEDCYLIEANNLFLGARLKPINTFFKRKFFIKKKKK